MGDKKIKKKPKTKSYSLPASKPEALILKENLNVEIYSLLKFISLFIQQHLINPYFVEISVGHTLGHMQSGSRDTPDRKMTTV